MLVLVLGGILTSRPRNRPPQSAEPPAQSDGWTPSAPATGQTVQLEIDFGNGSQRVYSALPWHEGMTVAEVLQEAHDFRPGIEFTQKGEGSGGFLTSLEGVKNEGTDGCNWLYEVAGNPGTQSFCVQTVGEGEQVLWRFAAKSPEQ